MKTGYLIDMKVTGSRKASNKAGRAVSWEQGRRREHGEEGTGVSPPAQSNRMKSSTPMSVCRRMARKVPRSSSRCARGQRSAQMDCPAS
jgi:hypothetical protein